jgi:hypothetical protein
MLLQLKDLASQKLISVPEEGLTFGREGGDAQVQVADMGVSKRHAEVFCEGGAWFLKDLGSSNGTMLANERIADATEILPGDVFQLSKRKFEVLKVVEDDGDEAPPEDDDVPPMTEPERKAPAKPAPKVAAKSAPPPAKKPAAGNMAKAGNKPEPTRAAPSDDDGGGGGDEIGNASVGQVLAGVPKAIGYYLVNVPLLLLNPFGTVRKAIEEQPRDPMGKMELIAWALPGNLLSGAMGFIGGLIGGLIGGNLAVGALIGGLVFGAIFGVVGAVVTGLIWHWLLDLVITKVFKGESDARGRTNYFLQFQTATILVALPTALTIIITAIRFRFGIPVIGIIPVLLSAAGGALTLFVSYKWMEFFNVAKWVKIVLLVLLALTALGALTGIPGALSGGGGGVSIPTAGSAGDGDVGDIDDAQKQALEAMKAAGATAEQIKQAEEAYKASREALKAAGAAGADAAKAAEEATKAAAEAAKAGAEAAKAGADAAKKAGEDVKKAGEKAGEDTKKAAEDAKKAAEDAKKAAAEDTKKPPPPDEAKPVAEDTPKGTPAAAVPSGGGYPAWHTKFENIEKRVTDDPTVLRKANVLKLYQELQEKSTEADAKVRKDYKKIDPRTFSHLRDAELFDSAGKTVDDLHKALFGR